LLEVANILPQRDLFALGFPSHIEKLNNEYTTIMRRSLLSKSGDSVELCWAITANARSLNIY